MVLAVVVAAAVTTEVTLAAAVVTAPAISTGNKISVQEHVSKSDHRYTATVLYVANRGPMAGRPGRPLVSLTSFPGPDVPGHMGRGEPAVTCDRITCCRLLVCTRIQIRLVKL